MQREVQKRGIVYASHSSLGQISTNVQSGDRTKRRASKPSRDNLTHFSYSSYRLEPIISSIYPIIVSFSDHYNCLIFFFTFLFCLNSRDLERLSKSAIMPSADHGSCLISFEFPILSQLQRFGKVIGKWHIYTHEKLC